jgi:DNA-binding transcriptional LysR family regulator
MDLSDLRIFRTGVDAGGVTAAAGRLNRVQSNVSARLRTLEDELGAPLFDRIGRRLKITPNGRVLLAYADRLLALAEEAQAAVRGRKPPNGVLRIGTMESTAGVRLPGLLGEFQRLHPDVRAELQIGAPRELAARVLAGESDAAFVAEPVADARLATLPAFDEELVLVTEAGHPPVRRPADLRGLAVIVFHAGCPHRERIEQWFARGRRGIERLTEIGSYHALLGCVAAGMGCALVPRSVLAGIAGRERLREHELPRPFRRAWTLLVWHRERPDANVAALAALLAPARKSPARGR